MEELFRGVIGGAFFITQQAAVGKLSGYLLHVSIQSLILAGLRPLGPAVAVFGSARIALN